MTSPVSTLRSAFEKSRKPNVVSTETTDSKSPHDFRQHAYRCFQKAITHKLSSYDAAYLEPAMRLGLDLAFVDVALVNALTRGKS